MINKREVKKPSSRQWLLDILEEVEKEFWWKQIPILSDKKETEL